MLRGWEYGGRSGGAEKSKLNLSSFFSFLQGILVDENRIISGKCSVCRRSDYISEESGL